MGVLAELGRYALGVSNVVAERLLEEGMELQVLHISSLLAT